MNLTAFQLLQLIALQLVRLLHSVTFVDYTMGSCCLYCIHRVRGEALAQGMPASLVPPAPPSFHWARRELRWVALADIPATPLIYHSLKPGTWVVMAVATAAWLTVQRWNDNHDCNCDDAGRHRRKQPSVVSRVTEALGRLVVVPSTGGGR